MVRHHLCLSFASYFFLTWIAMYVINSLIQNGKYDYLTIVSEPYRTQGWSAEESEEAGSKAPEDMTPFHGPTQYQLS